jgi:hypothetical protein
MSAMDSKKRTSYLLLIIGVLVLALAGSIGYIVGDLNSKSTPVASISDNEAVMNEIEELKAMYDSKIVEKTNSFRELKDQKKKIKALVYELEQSKSDAQALLKYKTQYQQLESKMKVLVNEIVVLKSGKSSAVAKVKSTQLPDNPEKTKSTPVFNKRDATTQPKTTVATSKELPKPVTSSVTSIENTPQPIEKKAVKEEVKFKDYKVSNLQALTYNVKSSGKQEVTNAARKVKLLRITFTVNGYSGSVQDFRTYYIQIINSKNNVMGKRITEFFNDQSLTYSYTKSVDLSDGTVNVVQDIYEEDFEKGIYFINIFDRSRLVSNSSITLQ